MNEILELPIGLVFRNEEQPRQNFPQEHIDGLARSIAENGLLQPITVRKISDERYEIVAGECRTRAVRQLGLPTIRAIVATDMADSERDILAIIENLQRRDINVMEEARAYQRMLNIGWSVEELAKRLGLRQPHRIRDRVLLLQMRPEYQGLTEQGHLTPYQAWFMAQLDPQRQDRLFKAIKDGKVTDVEKLKVFGEALLSEQSQGSMFGDAETGKLSEEEQEKVSRLEKKVEALASMVAAGFDKDNGVDIARKVAPHRAVEMAEKLELIAKHIAILTKELRKSAAQIELAA